MITKELDANGLETGKYLVPREVVAITLDELRAEKQLLTTERDGLNQNLLDLQERKKVLLVLIDKKNAEITEALALK